MKLSSPLLRMLGLETAASAQRLFTEDLYSVRPGASISSRGDIGYGGATDGGKPYRMVADGIAEVRIEGVLSKRQDLFRWLGLSEQQTLPEMAAAVRAAAADADVRGILLYVDSPGGSVLGTLEVAQAVAAARAAKPVHAYGRDECASCAYWIASQASRLTCNAVAHVGAIGIYSVLVDASALNEAMGLRFVVIKSGEFKGAGNPNVELTDEQQAYFLGRIQDCTTQFKADIVAGRPGLAQSIETLADGRCHIGQKAVAAGLADGVGTYQEALAALVAEVGAATQTRPPAEPQPEALPPEDEDEADELPEASALTGDSPMSQDTKPAPTGEADEERSFVRRFMDFVKSGGSGEPAAAAAAPASPVALTEEQIDARIEAKVAARVREQEVDADLKALDGKVPPSVLKDPEVRAMLLEAKAKGPERYAAAHKVVAGNDASALLGGPIADAAHADDARVATETEAMLERNGIKPERAAELQRRYHISVN